MEEALNGYNVAIGMTVTTAIRGRPATRTANNDLATNLRNLLAANSRPANS